MIKLEAARQILEGQTLKGAQAIADTNQWQLRIMRRDGEYYMGTADYNESRVNISVDDGIVDEVLSVG